MKKTIPYGITGKLEFELPEKNLIWEATPRSVSGVKDEEAEIEAALNHPIASATIEETLQDAREGKIKDQVGASAHIMIGVMRRMAHVIVVSSGVLREEALHMGFSYADSIREAIEMAMEREGKDAAIGILTHGADMAPLILQQERQG